MAATLIRAGTPGNAPVEVTFVSTEKTIDLYLAYDLSQVCSAFKTLLGIDSVAARVLPAMVSNRDIMIEVVGSLGGPGSLNSTITVHFHILKLRAALDNGSAIGAESAIFTANLLINLLEANNHFGNLGGIQALSSWNYISGQLYIPPVNIRQEHQDQFDGALVEATYTYTNNPIKQTL